MGSTGFSGTGWEKRGSRRGISGSGSEAGEGRVFGGGRSVSARTNTNGGRTKSFSAADHKKAAASQEFRAGDTVDHKVFGRGKVLKVDGDMLTVKFAKTNQTKKLMKDFAPIVKIG